MHPPKVILFPTTHEQSLPTFHVREEFSKEFLKFLADSGVEIWEEPASVGDESSDDDAFVQILIKEGTPFDKLEQIRRDFLGDGSKPQSVDQ